MKLTKQNLTHLIKEAISDDPDMGNWIARLTLGMNELYSKYYELNADIDDLRVDLNNYIESGDKPKELQQQVIQPGDPSRTAGISDLTNPGGKAMSEAKMKLTKQDLVEMIKEEVLRLGPDDVPSYSTPVFEGLSQILEEVMYIANRLLEEGDTRNYESLLGVANALSDLRKMK